MIGDWLMYAVVAYLFVDMWRRYPDYAKVMRKSECLKLLEDKVGNPGYGPAPAPRQRVEFPDVRPISVPSPAATVNENRALLGLAVSPRERSMGIVSGTPLPPPPHPESDYDPFPTSPYGAQPVDTVNVNVGISLGDIPAKYIGRKLSPGMMLELERDVQTGIQTGKVTMTFESLNIAAIKQLTVENPPKASPVRLEEWVDCEYPIHDNSELRKQQAEAWRECRGVWWRRVRNFNFLKWYIGLWVGGINQMCRWVGVEEMEDIDL